MTTQNWGEVMTSKDTLRKIQRIVPNLTPEDRMILVKFLCCECKDDDELEMLTRPIMSAFKSRRRSSRDCEQEQARLSRENTLNIRSPKA